MNRVSNPLKPTFPRARSRPLVGSLAAVAMVICPKAGAQNVSAPQVERTQQAGKSCSGNSSARPNSHPMPKKPIEIPPGLKFGDLHLERDIQGQLKYSSEALAAFLANNSFPSDFPIELTI